jgi:hypothetical protein
MWEGDVLERNESVRVGSLLVEGVGGTGVLGSSSSPAGEGRTLDLFDCGVALCTCSCGGWAKIVVESSVPRSSPTCPFSTPITPCASFKSLASAWLPLAPVSFVSTLACSSEFGASSASSGGEVDRAMGSVCSVSIVDIERKPQDAWIAQGRHGR